MTQPLVIHWFRQDLRLADNPALTAAARAGKVMAIYILDDESAGDDAPGAASRWWLHESLTSLNASLDGKLNFFSGNAESVIARLCDEHPITGVYWNRCYEPWRIARDNRIKQALKSRNITAASFNASLLWEPWETLKADGTPYRVFTPFYKRGCLGATPPRVPIAAPANLTCEQTAQSLKLSEMGLLPKIRWDKPLAAQWLVGESHASARLAQFLAEGIDNYREGRNFPAQANVSRLSPHLHFGEISPNQAWYAAKQGKQDQNREHFLSELGWREFSYSLLYHFPALRRENLQDKFNRFPWRADKEALARWQQGSTGYPIVDAGMRELWQTGYMHNRVRMIVGSFLVKNLLLHWRFGEAWFWDCLVDADHASNSASWQWIAGCGADAAPYFRVFNPVTQGQKFDPTGDYTRRFVPELSALSQKYLHCPWDAPETELAAAGIKLGDTYPLPMVDLKASRESALQAFSSIKTPN
ncbi:MAG: cryptochrome/photolyase family protein [Pseudomonadota bacterium]